MARYLAQLGWDLILVARREDRLTELKKELCSVDVETIILDVGKQEDCFKLYELTKDKQVDMLINNAGFGLAGEFADADLYTELIALYERWADLTVAEGDMTLAETVAAAAKALAAL